MIEVGDIDGNLEHQAATVYAELGKRVLKRDWRCADGKIGRDQCIDAKDDEDRDHSLCLTRHGWDFSVVFYGTIPPNPLASLAIARQTRNHGKFLLAGKVWPILGEIGQLKVRDARSISPLGLQVEE